MKIALKQIIEGHLSVNRPMALEALLGIQNSLNVDASSAWLKIWREHTKQFVDLKIADSLVLESCPGLTQLSDGAALFAAQTYAAIILDEIADQIGVITEFNEIGANVFAWLAEISPDTYGAIRSNLRDTLRESREEIEWLSKSPQYVSSFLASIFQTLFPPQLRHLLGEYYTPEWLIDDAASNLSKEELPEEINVLDPAGGSGGFAVRLCCRLIESNRFKRIAITVSDVSLIAARFSDLNLAFLALWASKTSNVHVSFRSLCADTICDENPIVPIDLLSILQAEDKNSGDPKEKVRREAISLNSAGRSASGALVEINSPIAIRARLKRDQELVAASLDADIICGNPPWISWDGVLADYRSKIATQWGASSLVTAKGWRAKVAAGKNDLSTLFVLRAAERHAKRNAQMVFALPISVFQARHASAGFRLFKAGETRRYSVEMILDLSASSVFADAVNRASLGVFRVDQVPSYPIRYGKLTGVAEGVREYTWHLAQPIDEKQLGSPLVVAENDELELFQQISGSDYRARGGVNTGGANGIFWVAVVGSERDTVSIVNSAKSKGIAIKSIPGIVERGSVAPLLVGRDIKRWKASPSRNILFLYDQLDPKKPLPLDSARKRFPLAVNYLSNFSAELEGRKEYVRWGGIAPFYELYRIGPYTFAPYKVVWQHTGFRGSMKVAVTSTAEDGMIVPDQKVILIPFVDRQEAHYACAYLASSLVAQILNKYIGLDASTHVLDYIRLRRFDVKNRDHVHLAELSESAHKIANDGGDLVDVEAEIDAFARRVFFAAG